MLRNYCTNYETLRFYKYFLKCGFGVCKLVFSSFCSNLMTIKNHLQCATWTRLSSHISFWPDVQVATAQQHWPYFYQTLAIVFKMTNHRWGMAGIWNNRSEWLENKKNVLFIIPWINVKSNVLNNFPNLAFFRFTKKILHLQTYELFLLSFCNFNDCWLWVKLMKASD